jgi:uncharacterized protein
MRSATIYRVLAALLVLIAAVLAWSHIGHLDPLTIQPVVRAIWVYSPGSASVSLLP